MSERPIIRWHKDRGWSGIGYHYVIRHRALRTLYSTLPMVGCESALDELNALRRDPSLNALLEEIDQ